MKRLVLVLLVVMAFGAATAAADPIYVRSTGASADEDNTGVNGSVSGGQATVALDPAHPSWYSPAGRTWVSFIDYYSPTPSGQSYCDDAWAICNNEYVDFFHDFMLPAGLFSGTLSVLADDTADVYVNGVKVWDRAADYPTDLVSTCAGKPIGCLATTQAVIDIGGYLQAGTNLFAFKVFQENGTGFGLNYEAEMNVSSVPEPGSGLLLLGMGLAGLRALRKRG